MSSQGLYRQDILQPSSISVHRDQPRLIPSAVNKQAIVDYSPGEAKYSYGYTVSDGLTGDAKTRQESRDGDVVTGSYSVLQPDGRLRTVTYSADKLHGFQADVRYDGVEGPVAIPVEAPGVADESFDAIPIDNSGSVASVELTITKPMDNSNDEVMETVEVANESGDNQDKTNTEESNIIAVRTDEDKIQSNETSNDSSEPEVATETNDLGNSQIERFVHAVRVSPLVKQIHPVRRNEAVIRHVPQIFTRVPITSHITHAVHAQNPYILRQVPQLTTHSLQQHSHPTVVSAFRHTPHAVHAVHNTPTIIRLNDLTPVFSDHAPVHNVNGVPTQLDLSQLRLLSPASYAQG